jgi:hypothetical protein
MRDISLNTLPSEKQLSHTEMIQWEQYMPCGKGLESFCAKPTLNPSYIDLADG